MPVRILESQLIESFGPEELQRLIVRHLDTRWESIFSPADSLNNAVFKTVEWARQNGRLLDLARAAAEERPRNDLLQACAKLIPLIDSREDRLPILEAKTVAPFEPGGNGEQRRQGEQLGHLIAGFEYIRRDVEDLRQGQEALRKDVQQLLNRQAWPPGLWYISIVLVAFALAIGGILVATTP